MDMVRFPLFLFLVWLPSAAAQVEPPTNVSLHCGNLINTLEWSYGQFLPGLKFKVKIGSISSRPHEILVDPPTLQADLSFLDPEGEYLISVAAVVGENETKADTRIKFSYYMDSLAPHICFLDFPAVNVTTQQDGKVQIHFTHPWLLYQHKFSSGPMRNARRKKSHDTHITEPLPKLKYDVEIVNQSDGHQGFTCDKVVCNGTLRVEPTHEKPCLMITGEMRRMSVRATQEYCALPLMTPHKPNDNTYIYITVVVFLAVFVFALILYMVYKKQTKPQSAIPTSMTFKDRLRQMTFGTDQEVVSVPAMEPTSPTPLLTTTEEMEQSAPADDSSSKFDFLPIGVPAKDEGVSEDVSEDVEAVNDEGHQGYMPGNNLEEEDEVPPPSSGYEKRDLVVELAPDDQAEGYRG